MEYSQYVTAIIEDRRQHPRDDLVSILTGAKDDGILGRFESEARCPASTTSTCRSPTTS